MSENFQVRVGVSEIFRDSPNDQICRSSGYNLRVSVGMCVAASLFTALIHNTHTDARKLVCCKFSNSVYSSTDSS